MHRSSRILRQIAAACLAAFVLITPAHAGAKPWKMSEKFGQVMVESAGTAKQGSRGMVLSPGDTIATGDTGRAVIVRGGEFVIVSPNSRVRIFKPERGSGLTQFIQYAGSILFKIRKKETPHFKVETPYLAAVVKGTTFNVTVTAEGATVQVTEGRVEVSTLDGGASDLIIPGRLARVDARDRQALRILGSDEKTLRSPHPPAVPPTSANAAAASISAQDVSLGTAPAVQIGGSPSPDADHGGNQGFSGLIGTPILSEPVSLAAVTGGLISNRLSVDRMRPGEVPGPPLPPLSGNHAGDSSNTADNSGTSGNAGSEGSAPLSPGTSGGAQGSAPSQPGNADNPGNAKNPGNGHAGTGNEGLPPASDATRNPPPSPAVPSSPGPADNANGIGNGPGARAPSGGGTGNAGNGVGDGRGDEQGRGDDIREGSRPGSGDDRGNGRDDSGRDNSGNGNRRDDSGRNDDRGNAPDHRSNERGQSPS